MNSGIISIRYAKALLAFGKDKGSEETIYQETGLLARSFEAQPGLKDALANPVVPVSKKTALIITGSGGKISQEFMRFIQLIVKNKRLHLLQSICLMYGDLYRKERHIQEACLITASPLSPEAETQLRQQLEKLTTDTLEFRTKVKPSLIGGFAFYYDTYRLDASIASRLQAIRKKLT
ncbi:F0F1 ATP synthase subunit delta [Parabacteroides pacaensis]|uniref:F0F1 ATP synthase subunit delta n=1 Tax=Parabacteroides pacaensis TaxID=2086575 RepID=UPI000D0EBBF9|nr:F0F1 ATP synthase subunit delta [Parabacteroides pacaensis]